MSVKIIPGTPAGTLRPVIAAMFLVLLILISGCSGSEAAVQSTEFTAMDTVFSVRAGGSDDLSEVFSECEHDVSEIENLLSADVSGSDAYNLNLPVDALLDADPTFCEILSFAMEISDLTGGAYDPAAGSLTGLWNVRGGGPVPSDADISEALASSGADKLEVSADTVYKKSPGIMIDLSGIDKGYAVGKITERLFDGGASYGIVSAGHTVGVFGEKPDGSPFRIGVSSPNDPDTAVGYIITASGFVSISGVGDTYFEENGVRYHSVIDPSTGYPAESGLDSVAVLSHNSPASDALSEALLVMGYERGMELYQSDTIAFEAVFVCSDGSIYTTDGLANGGFELSAQYTITDTNTTGS